MKLVPNWSAVLRGAWSIRFMALAFVLTGIEALLPFIDPNKVVHRGLFAAATALIIPCAFIARLIAQKGITDGQ